MNNVVRLDEAQWNTLFDDLLTHMLEDLRKRLEERILTELDSNRKLDARTVGICLGITHNVIDDMLEDEEDE